MTARPFLVSLLTFLRHGSRSSIGQSSSIRPSYSVLDGTRFSPHNYLAAGIEASALPFWGMAVYRTTYENQPAWEAFVRDKVEFFDSLKSMMGERLVEHKFRVFDDPALEGCNLGLLRSHFANEVAEQKSAHSALPKPESTLRPWALLNRDPGRQVTDPFVATWHSYFLVVGRACFKNAKTNPNVVLKLMRRAPESSEER
ncbi:hypothetical protein PGQ11_009913 [Apiospora arundinis]|uniref:Uncharacterized protein n=1 Tax=Apiospora arundinis TaxID=335852 RepID=A0ABR2I817_9PEZI